MTLRLYNKYHGCSDGWLDGLHSTELSQDWYDLVLYAHKLLDLESIKHYREVMGLANRLNEYILTRHKAMLVELTEELTPEDPDTNVVPFRP